MNYNNIENDIYVKPLLEFIHSKNSEIETQILSTINHTIYIKQINIDLIKKAAYFAKKYHGNQTRKSGEPYYSHPVAVALLLAENSYKYIQLYFTTELIAASLLHDTLEDTELTFEDIKNNFGIEIAINVEDLTRIKDYGKITSCDLINGLYHKQKYGSLLVKAFDRLHNINTLENSTKPHYKIVITAKETLSFYVAIFSVLNLIELEKILINLCLNFIKKYT